MISQARCLDRPLRAAAVAAMVISAIAMYIAASPAAKAQPADNSDIGHKLEAIENDFRHAADKARAEDTSVSLTPLASKTIERILPLDELQHKTRADQYAIDSDLVVFSKIAWGNSRNSSRYFSEYIGYMEKRINDDVLTGDRLFFDSAYVTRMVYNMGDYGDTIKFGEKAMKLGACERYERWRLGGDTASDFYRDLADAHARHHEFRRAAQVIEAANDCYEQHAGNQNWRVGPFPSDELDLYVWCTQVADAACEQRAIQTYGAMPDGTPPSVPFASFVKQHKQWANEALYGAAPVSDAQ